MRVIQWTLFAWCIIYSQTLCTMNALTVKQELVAEAQKQKAMELQKSGRVEARWGKFSIVGKTGLSIMEDVDLIKNAEKYAQEASNGLESILAYNRTLEELVNKKKALKIASNEQQLKEVRAQERSWKQAREALYKKLQNNLFVRAKNANIVGVGGLSLNSDTIRAQIEQEATKEIRAEESGGGLLKWLGF